MAYSTLDLATNLQKRSNKLFFGFRELKTKNTEQKIKIDFLVSVYCNMREKVKHKQRR